MSIPTTIDNYDSNYALVEQYHATANTSGMFAAKYPGELGNSLRVSVWCDQDSVDYDTWEYSAQFEGVSGTTIVPAAIFFAYASIFDLMSLTRPPVVA